MPTSTAQRPTTSPNRFRTLVDRLADAKLTQELAKRGRDVADEVGSLPTRPGAKSKPMRRDASKQLQHAVADAAKWSDRTWRKSVRPALKDLWKRRTVAISAAGAAVPAAGAVIDDAAIRLGVKKTAALGRVLPRPAGRRRGRRDRRPAHGAEAREEMRDELAAHAPRSSPRKAKDEWVPIFQRATNGGRGPR